MIKKTPVYSVSYRNILHDLSDESKEVLEALRQGDEKTDLEFIVGILETKFQGIASDVEYRKMFGSYPTI